MPENEAKRCFMRSLSYWSNKTLESNMSLRDYHVTEFEGVYGKQ